jgi:hypothetical protein
MPYRANPHTPYMITNRVTWAKTRQTPIVNIVHQLIEVIFYIRLVPPKPFIALEQQSNLDPVFVRFYLRDSVCENVYLDL